ncbi:uncharacterized protein LOC107025031 [Solanum pennellii]|uniref:Uncharacterized protein LOC107025031 n=1 Tax=Solanum pennellii TaxID=28526 RepID=A0ABM1H7B2_SOLPN|nr:uncharacterized protein LOC107025031 [Solanum pennellii]
MTSFHPGGCHLFQKWVEASTFKAVTKKAVVDFVRNNIVCRFGIPESIITDNAANLKSYLMKKTCERLKIAHRNSTVYQPQMNGAVETANKSIKNILRKIVDSHKQWHEKLPLTKAFKKKVKPRQFTLGKLVLKKIFPHQEEAKGKFAPNWQGPYMVHRVHSRGAVILEEMDSRGRKKPISSDAIKKYYI